MGKKKQQPTELQNENLVEDLTIKECHFCHRLNDGDDLPDIDWTEIEHNGEEGLACSFCQYPVRAAEYLFEKNRALIARANLEMESLELKETQLKESESIEQDKRDRELALAKIEAEEAREQKALLFSKSQIFELKPSLPDIAVDNGGNVYLIKGHSVIKIDSHGRQAVFAGNGEPGYSGDGSLAINAQLNSPSSIAVQSDGSVYICDAGNRGIRKVTRHGIITTLALLD